MTWEGWTVADRTMTFALGDGRELKIITEMIEVTSMSEPDPHWRHTDRAGHVHMAAGTDDSRVAYPTLETYSEDHICGIGCEEDGCLSYLGCRICGERISPAQRAGRPRLLRGRTTYTLDGEHVSPAVAQALVSAWQRAADDRSRAAGDRNRKEGYL